MVINGNRKLITFSITSIGRVVGPTCVFYFLSMSSDFISGKAVCYKLTSINVSIAHLPYCCHCIPLLFLSVQGPLIKLVSVQVAWSRHE